MCARGLSGRGTSSFKRTSGEIFIVKTGRRRALGENSTNRLHNRMRCLFLLQPVIHAVAAPQQEAIT